MANRMVGNALCVLWLSACDYSSPLDVIGAEETVIETRDNDVPAQPPPEFDPELSVVENFDGCLMRVNKSASITALTLKDIDRDLRDVIFPTRAEALAALGDRAVVPSMEVVNAVLKSWNDELYATIELLSEHGEDGVLVDKRSTFDAILSVLVARAAAGDQAAASAAADFGAAQRLAGGDPALPAEIDALARARRSMFDRSSRFSKPIGFYTWNEALETIYRRDRFLQTALAPGPQGVGPAAAFARALEPHPALIADYARVLELYRGLTNPFRDFDPLALLDSVAMGPVADVESAFIARHPELAATPPCQVDVSWLPASDSPETKLQRTQICAGNPPQNLLDALIDAIQSGAIDLTPSAHSGFYDHQLFALETLLLPDRSAESRHLRLSQKYRDKLVDTFKSTLIQTRETHVKQLGTLASVVSAPAPEPRRVDLYPLLPVEPFPTFYLRSARAYGFLQGVLRASLGERGFASATRIHADGTRAQEPLEVELKQKAEWLYGMHLVAAASIGMRDALSADERALLDLARTEHAARSWLAGWRKDAEVLRDSRVAVPTLYDAKRRIVQNLAVVGIKVVRASAQFADGTEPDVRPETSNCAVRGFVPFEPYMLVEQSLEFERNIDTPPLDRDELRAAIGGERSLAGIRARLEAP